MFGAFLATAVLLTASALCSGCLLTAVLYPQITYAPCFFS